MKLSSSDQGLIRAYDDLKIPLWWIYATIHCQQSAHKFRPSTDTILPSLLAP